MPKIFALFIGLLVVTSSYGSPQAMAQSADQLNKHYSSQYSAVGTPPPIRPSPGAPSFQGQQVVLPPGASYGGAPPAPQTGGDCKLVGYPYDKEIPYHRVPTMASKDITFYRDCTFKLHSLHSNGYKEDIKKGRFRVGGEEICFQAISQENINTGARSGEFAIQERWYCFNPRTTLG